MPLFSIFSTLQHTSRAGQPFRASAKAHVADVRMDSHPKHNEVNPTNAWLSLGEGADDKVKMDLAVDNPAGHV